MHATTIPSLPTRSPFTWMSVLETILLVELREHLDTQTADGREDVPFARGL